MNAFRLYALGPAFDVDAYVASSPLPWNRVWHCGETKPGGSGKFPTNGCYLDPGDGRTVPPSLQAAIAAEFLRDNEKAVRELSETPGVDFANLGLQFQLEPDVRGASLSISQELMRLAVRTGVTITFYVGVTRERDICNT